MIPSQTQTTVKTNPEKNTPSQFGVVVLSLLNSDDLRYSSSLGFHLFPCSQFTCSTYYRYYLGHVRVIELFSGVRNLFFRELLLASFLFVFFFLPLSLTPFAISMKERGSLKSCTIFYPAVVVMGWNDIFWLNLGFPPTSLCVDFLSHSLLSEFPPLSLHTYKTKRNRGVSEPVQRSWEMFLGGLMLLYFVNCLLICE